MRAVGQHRHVGGHRFEQRHAEALVLGQRDVDAGGAVVGGQVLVRDRPGEDEPIGRHLVLGDERPDHVVVARHAVGLADEDEAVVDVDVALVDFGQPDVILDLLVRDDPADEQEVQRAVAEHPLERRTARRRGDPGDIDGDREDAGVVEAQRVELVAVEGRVAQRDVGPPGQRRQLLAAERGEPEDAGVVGREEVGRGHVVVLEHAPAGQPGERLGHRRGQRVVEDGQVAVPRRRIGERPDVAAQVVVDGQGEQVRVVAHRAQQPAHAPGGVADGVAAMRRRHPLVDDHADGASGRRLGPVPGSRARARVRGLGNSGPGSFGSAW